MSGYCALRAWLSEVSLHPDRMLNAGVYGTYACISTGGIFRRDVLVKCRLEAGGGLSVAAVGARR